jgi:hypothetical protein
VLLVAGDFAGADVALGELVALAVPLTVPDFVALGEAVVACLELVGAALLACFELGVALTLRVLPLPLDDAGEAASVGVAAPDVFVGVADADVSVGDVSVGVADADGFGVGVGVLPVVGSGVGNVLGVGAAGGLAVFVAVLVGDGDGDLDAPGLLEWDSTSSHRWLAPVTTDAVCVDSAAEALDAPAWSAEATIE